jgi:hypothetical protein
MDEVEESSQMKQLLGHALGGLVMYNYVHKNYYMPATVQN